MDERISLVAALANLSDYDEGGSRHHIDGAPHIKHTSLRAFYAGLVVSAR